LYRFGIIQRAGNPSYKRIHQYHSGQFATGQYIVADGNLVINFSLQHPLIHPFISSRQQYQTVVLSQFLDNLLRQWPALRGKKDGAALLYARTGLPLPSRPQRLRERLGHHYHAGTATIRPVIHASIRIGAEISWIPQHQLVKPAAASPLGNTASRQCIEHLRE